jgi:hypothetical protein
LVFLTEREQKQILAEWSATWEEILRISSSAASIARRRGCWGSFNKVGNEKRGAKYENDLVVIQAEPRLPKNYERTRDPPRDAFTLIPVTAGIRRALR